MEQVLKHFNLIESDRLGSGGESIVYACDEQQVLRLYKQGTSFRKLEILKRFYDELDTSSVEFEVPVMTEIGTVYDIHYSIEPRIAGSDLTTVFSKLSSTQRQQTLKDYIQIAGCIHKIPFDADYYGEIMPMQPIRKASWSDYLKARADMTLQDSYHDLREDVPHFENLLHNWHESLKELSASNISRSLVHGDYFPGNLMALDNGKITAVIDFSPISVVGDWRMDIAGALLFLEVTSAYQEKDSTDAYSFVKDILGDETPKLLKLYQIYYALYFSAAKGEDDFLYSWCVKKLKEIDEV